MARHCFAPGCDTGYQTAIKRNKALGKKNPSLFSAPKEAEILKKWQRTIPRADKVFAPPCKLCELHFDEDCILRATETKLFDGSVFHFQREKPILKPGSVPTKFPNLPKYFSRSETPKRKAPASRNKRKHLHESEIPQNNQMQDDTMTQVQDNTDNFFKDFEKPNKWWTISKNDDGSILCVKLDGDCHCERHVMIHKDFSVKIFLRNKEIKLENESKIQSMENLSHLLKKVDDLVICKQLESW